MHTTMNSNKIHVPKQTRFYYFTMLTEPKKIRNSIQIIREPEIIIRKKKIYLLYKEANI